MGWLREALRQAKLAPPSEFTEPLEDRSHCGCVLPEGCWGDSGWHFYRLTPERLYKREKWAFAKERPNMTREALRREWSEWMATEEDAGRVGADGVLDRFRTYIGLPEAYERCPAYQASMNREQGRDRP